MVFGVLLITIDVVLLIIFFQNIKKLLVEEIEGRFRRLEMEVDEIELKLTKRSNN